MGDFKKPGGFGGGKPSFKKSFGRPSFAGRQNFKQGGGDRPDRNRGEGLKPQMYSAVCSSCGNKCEVPFRPSGERPVLCSDCYKKREDFPPKGAARETAVYRPKGQEPTPRPSSAPTDSRIDDLARQLALVHTKLDKLIASLPPASTLHDVVGDTIRANKKGASSSKPERKKKKA